MKYIKKLIRNSKRVLNQQVIKKKQEIVKYAPRLTGIQGLKKNEIGLPLAKAFQTHGPIQRRGFADMLLKVLHYLTRRIKSPDS